MATINICRGGLQVHIVHVLTDVIFKTIHVTSEQILYHIYVSFF